MKISVIGTGKTGSKVIESLGERLLHTFDDSNPPTKEQLAEADAVIIFVPGDAVNDILETVLASGTPAAWGVQVSNGRKILTAEFRHYELNGCWLQTLVWG